MKKQLTYRQRRARREDRQGLFLIFSALAAYTFYIYTQVGV